MLAEGMEKSVHPTKCTSPLVTFLPLLLINLIIGCGFRKFITRNVSTLAQLVRRSMLHLAPTRECVPGSGKQEMVLVMDAFLLLWLIRLWRGSAAVVIGLERPGVCLADQLSKSDRKRTKID